MVRWSLSRGSDPVRVYWMTSPMGPRNASRYRRSRAAAYVAPPPTWTVWSLVVANAGSSDTAHEETGACPRTSVSSSGLTMPNATAGAGQEEHRDTELTETHRENHVLSPSLTAQVLRTISPSL